MKGTITQYITLGIMLLIMVLIVSFYPEQKQTSVTSQLETPTKVSKLVAHTMVKRVRTD